MGRGRNKFARAIKHIKSTQIDERLELLNEIPTNSTTGYMTAVPGGVGGVEWTDKTYTTDTGGNTIFVDSVDYDADADEYGQDTSGLFDTNGSHAAGTRVRTIEPPGDTSYVLGPMAAMYYTWSRPWTQIGYIRESDRRMVDLGRLEGKLSDWDGNADDLNSYGQLTLEQALWFRDVKKKDNSGNDPDNYNYRAFYPGPPNNAADGKGRYLCCIVGESKRIIGSQTRKGPSVPNISATGGDASTDLSAMLDRLVNSAATRRAKATGKNLWDIASGEASNNFLQGALNTLRGFSDKARFGSGDYIFKGLEKGTDYLPSFTGASNLNIFGKKIPKIADWNPLLKKLAGDNYASQYFTPDLDTAIKYAGEGGTVTAIPRTKGVRGWKNWLGSNVSRGFDPTKGIEQLVKTSDTIALKNVTKTFDLAEPASKEALEALAKKGVKSAGILGRLGRAVPFLNAGLVVADVTSRVKSGDYFGAVLGAAQIIPGPVGWISLGAQVAYDVDGHFNKNGFANVMKGKSDTFSYGEGYIMEEGEEQEQISTQGLGQALMEMGLPKDKNEYIQDIGFYLLLQGVNPQFLGIYLRALAGEKLSTEQEQWIQENIPVIVNGMSDIYDNGEGEEPFYTEDDPWALEKQQTQESVLLSEERKLSIIKKLKEPVVIPETKQKSYKVRPGRKGKTNFQGMDKLMGDIKPQKSFKEPQDIWSDGWQGHNARLSQGKKNIVLEKIGEGKQAWEYMLKYGTKMDAKNLEEFWGKNPDFYSYCFDGKKYKSTRKEQVKGDYVVFLVDEAGETTSMLQSELNIKLSEESDKQMLAEYTVNEPIPFTEDPLLKKVIKRLKNEIDYPDKPAVKGYPNEPPPTMVKGWHPEMGKRYKYDKLDPVSAIAMRNAPTGDPEIDPNGEKTAKKLK